MWKIMLLFIGMCVLTVSPVMGYCGPCYEWIDGECKWQCDGGSCCNGSCCYGTCCKGSCCYGTCCNGSCCPSSECKTCVNGSCQSACKSAQCETCQNGSCKGCETEFCESCVNGDCEVCGGDLDLYCTYDEFGTCCNWTECETYNVDSGMCEGCPAGKVCEDGTCNCNNCWRFDIKQPNYHGPCAACDNANEFGCAGEIMWIQNSYSYYTGETVGTNEYGLCRVKTKQAVIGEHKYCTSVPNDLQLIIDIIDAIDAAMGYADCVVCLSSTPTNAKACMDCLAELIGVDAWDLLPICAYVKKCDYGVSIPLEEDVVDWDSLDTAGEGADDCYGK
jgi:hypothetical protein